MLFSAGTQKTNAGTQLASLLGTIRLGLGTQQGKAYKPGKRDDNVVSWLSWKPFVQ